MPGHRYNGRRLEGVAQQEAQEQRAGDVDDESANRKRGPESVLDPPPEEQAGNAAEPAAQGHVPD